MLNRKKDLALTINGQLHSFRVYRFTENLHYGGGECLRAANCQRQHISTKRPVR